jgi:AraC family transcriptional regulator of adaptative response / DNA-3-methyladenine glycosylase II
MIADAVAHAAVEAKDARFDGRFFIGVSSTGVYCRCICPARTPKPANRRFFPSAAAAEGAGFRPCLVCRPEAAPGLAPIEQTGRIAAAALAEIEAGALDEGDLEALAGRLRVSARHLRRAVAEAFGASPIALAQTHRLLTAKRLLQETDIPMTEVAFAAGFASLRRFNALFKARYGRAPSEIRRGRSASGGDVGLALTARGLWRPQSSFAALQLRALFGVEGAGPERYARTLAIGARAGWVEARATATGLAVRVSPGLLPALRPLIVRIRTAFDLDCDVERVDAALAQSALLADEVAAHPGLRLAGGLDPFEIGVRAVLGQQVSLKRGLVLATRLVERFGRPIETPDPSLHRLFPTPHDLADAGAGNLQEIGLTRRRAQTLADLAAAVRDRGAEALRRPALVEISGIGPWTADYVALRAHAEPDAAPAGDAVLTAEGLPPAPALSPWRGYAAMRLWARAARERGERPCPS